MSNSYFQFKQFTVYQDKCAMKVCTDACLFGAVTARYFQQKYQHTIPRNESGDQIRQILDVGSGTGLLSLMLTQETWSHVDAIEINGDAYMQSVQNISLSPWKDRVHVIHADFKCYTFDRQYDFVISNPPFFKSHLPSPDHRINLARHSPGLVTEDLIRGVASLLSPTGCFAVMIPYQQSANFIYSASLAGLYLNQHLAVRQSDNHPFFRSILFFDLQRPGSIRNEDMSIKNDQQYSEEFKELLKDYYLHL